MKQIFKRGMLLTFLGLGFNQSALAHVNYGNINAIGSAGIFDTFTSYGWGQGQIQPGTNVPPQGSLATTDDVNWYSFTLTQTSEITLKLTSSALAGTALAAPAFSIYSGLFVKSSYDVNPIIPLLSDERGLVNTAGSFALTTDSITLTQAQANLRTINFITSATGSGNGTAELVNYVLGPGSYSVIAGGNSPYTLNDDGYTNYGAVISYAAVSAVPVPGAFGLMSSALAVFGFFGRRKYKIAA